MGQSVARLAGMFFSDTRRDFLEPLRSVRMVRQFKACLRYFPDRRSIIAEGDSWFGYPPHWLAFGRDANILDHLEQAERFNFLRLELFGALAHDMLRNKSMKRLRKALKASRRRLDFLLFSGGGNDLLAPEAFSTMLHRFEPGMAAADCLDRAELAQRLGIIRVAYQELVRLRDAHTPEALIVTHDYDFLLPDGEPAVLLGGLIKQGPWLKPALENRGIPAQHHFEIVRILLEEFSTMLESFVNHRFMKVHTQGTLVPGNRQDWLNEIHPTAHGFGKIAAVIFRAALQ